MIDLRPLNVNKLLFAFDATHANYLHLLAFGNEAKANIAKDSLRRISSELAFRSKRSETTPLEEDEIGKRIYLH